MTVYRVQPAKSSDLSYPKVRPAFDENFIETKTLDPSMTFSRSSGGTYVGPDGLIKIAGVNQPRFDHDPLTGECRGLLVEESRTNLVTNSRFPTFRQSERVSIETIPSILLPDGTTDSVVRVTNTDNTNIQWYRFSYTNTATANVLYSGSLWIRAVQGSFQVDFNTSQVNALQWGDNPITLTTQWQRISDISIPYGTELFMDIKTNTGSPLGLAYYIWGVQLEQASFPTSYIPTSGSVVTRAADRPIINRTINTSGTLFAEATTPRTSGTIASADNGTSAIAITLNNANTSRYALYYNTNRYLQISSNTSSIPTEVLQTQIPTGLNRVSLGYSELGSGSYINGHIRRFTYYSSLLSESNVKALVGNTNNTFRDSIGIVTPGLVLNLDAGNIVSYSGGGNTWFDLSGNGNNGTLTNDPTYSNANGGSLVFDGTNDYVDFGNSSIFNQSGGKSFTVTCWALFNTASAVHNPIFNKAAANGTWEYTLGLNAGAGVAWLTSSNGTNWVGLGVGETIQLGIWYYYVVGFNFANQVSFASINGKQIYTTAQTGIYNGSRAFEIGRHNDPTTTMNGRISALNFYNRVLTETEIQQNFNTLRGRYGV